MRLEPSAQSPYSILLRLVKQWFESIKDEIFIGFVRKREGIGSCLVVERPREIKVGGRISEYFTHEKIRHHHHHRVDEMTCLDDEKMKKIRNDVPCHNHFEVVELGFMKSRGRLDSIKQCDIVPIQEVDELSLGYEESVAIWTP
ncbi:hypothetical protein Tco_1336607 [Tanacetum coccineum]